MDIAFDPAKDRRNLAKHGVSLALAAELEWELAWVREDLSEAYDERRWRAYAPIGEDLYCVVFTEDSDIYRIISCRPARPKEIRAYVRHF